MTFKSYCRSCDAWHDGWVCPNQSDELALTVARVWAEKIMGDLPPGQCALITRQEYHELLTLAYAKGFKEGVQWPRGSESLPS